MIERVWMFVESGIFRSSSTREKYLRRLAEMNVTDAALVLHQMHSRVSTMPSAATVREVVDRVRALDMRVHLMVFPEPTQAHMDDAAAALRPLCADGAVESVMFDVEENWTKYKLSETAARTAVGRYFEPAFGDWRCGLGLTAITFIPRSVAAMMESPLLVYALPQAYSITRRSGDIYRPGVTQRKAHQLWKRFQRPMVMGLAAYCSRFADLGALGSLEKAFSVTQDELADPAVRDVAYWSMANIYGDACKDCRVDAPVKMQFLRAISDAARAGHPYRYRAITPRPPGPHLPSEPVTPPPPAPGGASADTDRAVRLNRKHAESLGWGNRFDDIVALVGFTTFTPTEAVFVPAVARWQAAHGLTADGIIGPKTWAKMRAALPAGELALPRLASVFRPRVGGTMM